MQVGVLLNHYEPHQVPHVVPYAFALSRLRPDWRIRILCSTGAEAALATRIGAAYPGHAARIEPLAVPLHCRLVDPVSRHVAFYRKQAVRRANRRLLAGFDALVVPEVTSLSLREETGPAAPALIFTGHGAGDFYSNPFGMFDPRLARFDLVLLQGGRIAADLRRHGGLDGMRYAVAGYPKFEAMSAPAPRFFDNADPVVLYNPTQNPRGTSWHRFGEAVLDAFAARDDLNLIFAPHALLFKRSLTRGARLPRRVRTGPRLRVDTGSPASFDMTYTRAADLYLGDQSSQVYEFVRDPRPCVFLNAAETGWQGNPDYRSWSFGPVVESAAELMPAIDAALAGFERWRPAQEAALAEDAPDPGAPFPGAPPSERGARAVAEFLETGRISEAWR